MALCKIVLIGALIAACRALVNQEDALYNTHPQYDFSYSVHDPLTGDSKTQTETRNGDVVHGSYSLVEPDGSVRTVKYTASDATGFNAVVEKSGTGAAPASAVVAQDVARSAAIPPPAPVSVYSAPVVRTEPRGFTYSFATPVSSYARAYQPSEPSYSYYKPAVSYYQEPRFFARAYQPYQELPNYSRVRYQQPVSSSGYSSPFARLAGSNYVKFSSPHVSYSH